MRFVAPKRGQLSPLRGRRATLSRVSRRTWPLPHHAGREVVSLDYEAFDARALRTMREISQQACDELGVMNVCVRHRLGRVPVGEDSIIIAVAAPHRRAAWRAGEFVLDEVKRRVEVWKREMYEDGSVWKENPESAPGQRTMQPE